MSSLHDGDHRLLEDIPAYCFRSLIHRLEPRDCASMRQTSRFICKRTTEQIPSITLCLCNRYSSTDYLQQWCQATKQLQHVRKVLVVLENGYVDFHDALRMLSEHRNITRLCLCSKKTTVHDNSSSIDIPSGKSIVFWLLPVTCVINQLEELSFDGICFSDFKRDLEELAAAAAAARSWPLKILTIKLEADWILPRIRDLGDDYLMHWSEFAGALKHLPNAFPNLTTLCMRVPKVEFEALSARSGLPHSVVQLHHHENSSAVAIDRHVAVQLSKVAVVTALANTALQLKHLAVLSLYDVPDIWCCGQKKINHQEVATPSAAATAATTPASLAAIADAYLVTGQLQSTTAAAALFLTMDAYGCWLLQHHPTLNLLKLLSSGCYGETLMKWRKQHQQKQPLRQQQQQQWAGKAATTAVASAASAAEPALCDLLLDFDADLPYEYPPHRNVCSSSSSSRNSVSNSSDFFMNSLQSRMSPLSFRPRLQLLSTIRVLYLQLDANDAAGKLAGVFGDLKSLKHLEIELYSSRKLLLFLKNSLSTRHHRDTVRSAVAAAAAVTGLQTLAIRVERGLHVLPVDLLLPLTAAAGGPGSSLTRLELYGSFVAETKAHYADLGLNLQQHMIQAAKAATTDFVNAASMAVKAAAAAVKYLRFSSEAHNTLPEGHRTQQQTDSDDALVGPTSGASSHIQPHTVISTSDAVVSGGSDSSPSVIRLSAGEDEKHDQHASLDHVQIDACMLELPEGSDAADYSAKQQQQQQPSEAAPVNPLAGSAWHVALQQLTGLRELTIKQFGSEHLSLPVGSLPASLESLIVSATADGFLEAIVNTVWKCSWKAQKDAFTFSGRSKPHAYKLPRPKLRRLQLAHYGVGGGGHLHGGPGILASDQLQQLTIIDSGWSGGWGAAAAAWPNLQKLTWKWTWKWDMNMVHTFHSTAGATRSDQMLQTTAASENRSTSSSSQNQTPAADESNDDITEEVVVSELHDILLCFKHLRYLTVTDLPCNLTQVMFKQPLLKELDRVQRLKLAISDDLHICAEPSLVLRLCRLQKWLQRKLPCTTVCISF